MSDLIYTNIQHIPRKKHWLTLNEYCICDMVYHLSNNPKYLRCIKTKQWFGEDLWLSKQSVLSLIEKMIVKWFIEKDPNTKHIKTTKYWYDEFVLAGKESLPKVKKDDNDGKESLPPMVKKVYQAGKESLPNIYIYNNKDKEINNNNIINTISSDIDGGDIILSNNLLPDKYIPKPITQEINFYIDFIKNICKNNWIIFSWQTDDRNYCKHLLSKKFKKDCLDELWCDLQYFLQKIIELSSKTKYSKIMSSAKIIYYNRAEVINKSKQQNSSEKPIIDLSKYK